MPTPAKKLAAIVRDIKEAEGVSYRGLERLMVERTGERVTTMWLTNAAAGMIREPGDREIRKLAAAFPDFAGLLHALIGLPTATIPEDLAARLDTEAERRGSSRDDLLRLAVEEYLNGLTEHPRTAATASPARRGAPYPRSTKGASVSGLF